jgi:hypothetical protein
MAKSREFSAGRLRKTCAGLLTNGGTRAMMGSLEGHCSFNDRGEIFGVRPMLLNLPRTCSDYSEARRGGVPSILGGRPC